MSFEWLVDRESEYHHRFDSIFREILATCKKASCLFYIKNKHDKLRSVEVLTKDIPYTHFYEPLKKFKHYSTFERILDTNSHAVSSDQIYFSVEWIDEEKYPDIPCYTCDVFRPAGIKFGGRVYNNEESSKQYIACIDPYMLFHCKCDKGENRFPLRKINCPLDEHATDMFPMFEISYFNGDRTIHRTFLSNFGYTDSTVLK
jgi:hypothetical protein